MTNTNKTPWLKLIGWPVLIHIILIALSFLEVFIYAMLINPGMEESFYEKHAELTAPYVSIIFGVALFFLVAKRLTKTNPDKWLVIALVLPFVYIALDLLMLLPYDVNWGENFLVLVASFGSKIIAAFIGAKTANK